MGLLGGHQEDGREARTEGTSAIAGRKSTQSGGDKEGERYQFPEDNSDSDSGSGAETDDEASSTSDYPPQVGQPGVVPMSVRKRDTSSQGLYSGPTPIKKTTASQCEAVPKESSPLEASGTTSPLPTLLPPKQAVDNGDSESSNGGNEPDVSCSGSEGGGSYSLPQDQSEPQMLQLPGRLTTRHGSDHNSESESETSSIESVEDELEDLSLQNKLHQPHRDRAGDGQQKDTDSLSVASTTLTSTTNSYLYGENASDRVRHLVKRSMSKKKKQLQRQTRPKKETKAPTQAGRRSKKTNRNVLKNSMDVSIY